MKDCRSVSLLCGAVLFSIAGFAQDISTFAGCGIGDDSMATHAELCNQYGVATDNAGNSYIADYNNNVVRKVDAGGIITNFAGTGIYGYTGDGGLATHADVGNIYGVAADHAGNVYITDINHSVVRKINTSGIISTIAGVDDEDGFNGDGIPATLAKLNYPGGITVDTSGNVYIADIDNSRVRMVNTSGVITTVVGTGTLGYSGMGGPATAAEITYPYWVKFDKWGNMFVTDEGTDRLYKIDTTGIITNFAGTGTNGYSGDGGPATAAEMTSPSGLAVDTAGNVYFSDLSNSRVRMVNEATGIVTTVCGNGTAGFGGDGGSAISAEISYPRGLAFDNSGNLLISDQDNNRVRMVNQASLITTFAGRNSLFGEGYPAANAEMEFVQNLTTDAGGNLYIADIYNHRVRKVSASTGAMTTVAGAGISGTIDRFSGDGGPATAAFLHYPSAMAFDQEGNLYICDQDNYRIRQVNTSGVITTIAGNGTSGYAGDGAAATDAEISEPTGIVVDKNGNIYIADRDNSVIRMINPSGVISTVAGNHTNGYTGDGASAINAELNLPSDVALDGMGNLYICDANNNVIRMVDTSGNISTIAGNGAHGYSGDGAPAIEAKLAEPFGIKVDSAGDILIADHDNMRIRLVNTQGIISTVAGNGNAGFGGDGGPAVDAMLLYPAGVAFDNSGNLFISDGGNQRVRKTSLTVAVPRVHAMSQAIFAYPNPTVGLVYIANAPGGRYELDDVCGRVLMTGAVTANRQSMDISSLANGVYLLQVTNADGISKTEKIVKE